MSDCHLRRLERIQWKSGRICICLMRSTHVLSVEVLAGLPAIRQRLSFLNEKFLVSALVKSNDLLMVKLKELHRIWNKSNCLPEWQIVRESRIVMRTHFLTEFDHRPLGGFDICAKGTQRCADGFEGHRWIAVSYNCSETPGWGTRGPTAIYTDGSKTEGLVGFGIFLDDRDSYRFRLPGHCGIFTAEMSAIHFACDLIESNPIGVYIILTDTLTSIEGLRSTGISYRTNDMLFRTRRSLR
jgi:hypothetical protein